MEEVKKKRSRFKMVVYKDKAGEFRWSLRAGNGEVMADSAEGYTRKPNCLRIAKKIRSCMAEAVIFDKEADDRAQARAAQALKVARMKSVRTNFQLKKKARA